MWVSDMMKDWNNDKNLECNIGSVEWHIWKAKKMRELPNFKRRDTDIDVSNEELLFEISVFHLLHFGSSLTLLTFQTG